MDSSQANVSPDDLADLDEVVAMRFGGVTPELTVLYSRITSHAQLSYLILVAANADSVNDVMDAIRHGDSPLG